MQLSAHTKAQKLGTVARSGVGLFYLCELQVHHLIWQVPLELWDPFAIRHGDDCIAIATGKHSPSARDVSTTPPPHPNPPSFVCEIK